VVGLAVFVALVILAFRRLLSSSPEPPPLTPFVAASLLGVLLVGSISSILDVPRVSFLLWLLVFASLQWPSLARAPGNGTSADATRPLRGLRRGTLRS